MWVAFDFTRIVAAVALVALCILGGDPGSPAAIVLATFVVTGLMVSFVRHSERDR